MIFPASSANTRPIASALRARAQKLEEGHPLHHVLAAREFRYPVQIQAVSIRAEQYRKMNLLEKFILQAATEVFPRPSLEELADALGLDPIFVNNTVKDLRSMQSIAGDNHGLRATDEGQKSLASEIITEDPIVEARYFIQDTLLDTTTFSHFQLKQGDDDLEDLSLYIDQDLTQFPLFNWDTDDLQARLQVLSLDLHDPDSNRFVTTITPIAPPEIHWRTVSIFVLYDTSAENDDKVITFEARSFENKVIPIVNEWLEAQLHQGKLSLKTFCGLNDDMFPSDEGLPEEEMQGVESVNELSVEPEFEERLEEIHQQAVTQQRLRQEGQALEPAAGTSLQLRDMEIRPAFLKALQEAQELIIIYSPWMNEQVVDNEFISLLEKLVQRGVRILIGYGIGHDEKREDRPVPLSLLHRLQAVQTPEGTPGIIAEWLGNSHAKEVIIDHKIHFSGSHNWLSYRGDRFPRGETVYQVTLATEVEKAYDYLAQRFIEHAENLWEATDEENRLALCLLASLGYEQQAIEWIQQDERYDFLPLWLNLALQGISVGRETLILAPLQTALMLSCTAVAPQSSFLPEIIALLRKVFKSLAQKNQQLIITLVNDNLSELKQLELDQYIKDLNASDYQKQDNKEQSSDSSNFIQKPTQRVHQRNRSRRNR